MTPFFHPAAEQELAAAMEIGEARGSGLGAELLGEVRRIVALLCETPNIGEVAFSECGQCAESPRATKV
jgi:hypothetical protein